MFEALLELDNVKLNLGSGSSLFIGLTIAFVMFGVALQLKISDFIDLFKNPKCAFVGIFSQFIMMPALTFLFILMLGDNITPTVGLGMILVASCPGGNFSNFFSSLARGNIALSVSLTAFSSGAGIFLTPLNFTLWGNLFIRTYNNPGSEALVRQLYVPLGDVFATIVVILAIPLTLGILISTKYPNFTERVVIPIKRLSVLFFMALLAILFGMNFDYFIKYIYYVFVLVFIHNLLALSSGYYLAKWTGLNLQNRKTISIETGIQNSGLAIALLTNPNIFPAELHIGGMLFIAAWWGLWHIVSGMTLAGYWSGFSMAVRSNKTMAE
jgi:BASS family bile acid:Na+ symporter